MCFAVWGSGTRSRIYNSTGFFFLCWAAHYFPFYLMGRQRFLHHYLPSHLASALVAGALVEFIFNIDPANLDEAGTSGGNINSTKKSQVAHCRPASARSRLGTQSLFAGWAAAIAILSAAIWGFCFFAP